MNGKISQINSAEWGMILPGDGEPEHPVHCTQVQGYESGFDVAGVGSMGRSHSLVGSDVLFNAARVSVNGLELRVGSGGRIAGQPVGMSVTGVSIV